MNYLPHSIILVLWILALLVVVTLSVKSDRMVKFNTTSSVSTHFDDLSLYDIEYQLALHEQKRTIALYKKLRQKGYEIYGFYHTSTVGQDWQYVLREQLLLLDGRRKFPSKQTTLLLHTDANYTEYEWDMNHRYISLLDMSVGLFVNVASTDKSAFESVQTFISTLPLVNKDKLILQYSQSLPRNTYNSADAEGKKKLLADASLSEGEGPTITEVNDFCKRYTAVNDYQVYGHKIANFTSHDSATLTKHQQGIFHELFQMKQNKTSKMKDSTSTSADTTSTSTTTTTNTNNLIPKQRAIVYYLHAKRTCCITGNGALWREYMDAVNVEFPSICLRAIGLRKQSVCGTQRKNDHYSGNFWYSECEHISQLFEVNRFDWLGAESYSTHAHHFGEAVMKFSQDCAYSFAYYHRNLYDSPIYRYEYLEKLWYTITSPSTSFLPPTDPEDAYHEIPALRKFCNYIKKPHHYHDLITHAPYSNDIFNQLKIPKDGNPTPTRKSYYDLNGITWHYSLQKQIPKRANPQGEEATD